jgi:NAD+ synthetase
VLFCNQCGGNDELVFDGNSMALGQDGNIFAHGPAFEEELIMLDLSDYSGDQKDSRLEEIASVYKALVIGTRDYARKCGFKSAVVGLSGGIDSAVVACIAAEALGPSNVLGISMPTEFSSISSRMDADILARNLKIKFQEIPVQQIFESYLSEFKKLFPGSQPDVTEENIQARIRGNLLMAISNKQGHLVLSTGNKSELAMGYCTLYGDMCGGLAVISDVPKTMVYRIANEVINREDEIIPHTILAKPPSAELHPGQKDTDSLPEYEVLDPILKAYIEEGKSSQEIVGLGFEEAIVSDVINRVQRNEYKRRQAPLGLKVTSKAFGCGRRIPIAQRLHL